MADKRVSEMSDEEREKARLEALKTASESIARGNRNRFTLDFDALGQEGFTGKLVMHRPTLDEEREIGVRFAQYRGGLEVDVKTSNICFYFATFDVVVDDAPEWFKPQKLHDYELLNFVWEAYAEWRDTFRGFRNPKLKGNSETAKPAEAVVDTKRVEGSTDRPAV